MDKTTINFPDVPSRERKRFLGGSRIAKIAGLKIGLYKPQNQKDGHVELTPVNSQGNLSNMNFIEIPLDGATLRQIADRFNAIADEIDPQAVCPHCQTPLDPQPQPLGLAPDRKATRLTRVVMCSECERFSTITYDLTLDDNNAITSCAECGIPLEATCAALDDPDHVRLNLVCECGSIGHGRYRMKVAEVALSD